MCFRPQAAKVSAGVIKAYYIIKKPSNEWSFASSFFEFTIIWVLKICENFLLFCDVFVLRRCLNSVGSRVVLLTIEQCTVQMPGVAVAQ